MHRKTGMPGQCAFDRSDDRRVAVADDVKGLRRELPEEVDPGGNVHPRGNSIAPDPWSPCDGVGVIDGAVAVRERAENGEEVTT
jgi:hypothetical protein